MLMVKKLTLIVNINCLFGSLCFSTVFPTLAIVGENGIFIPTILREVVD